MHNISDMISPSGVVFLTLSEIFCSILVSFIFLSGIHHRVQVVVFCKEPSLNFRLSLSVPYFLVLWI